MKPLSISPVDLVLRVAAATVGACESPGGSNAGPYVDRVLRLVGHNPGQPWCAAHLAGVGSAALRKDWPAPKTAGCQALFDWAMRMDIVSDDPEPGDIFLIWRPELRRFAHTGFCIAPLEDGRWTTNSGNTTSKAKPADPTKAREGWLVEEKPWRFRDADRFARWATLLR